MHSHLHSAYHRPYRGTGTCVANNYMYMYVVYTCTYIHKHIRVNRDMSASLELLMGQCRICLKVFCFPLQRSDSASRDKDQLSASPEGVCQSVVKGHCLLS